MRALIAGAWSVLGVDAALIVLIAAFGVLARDSVESATMFAMAVVATVPLAAVAGILYLCTRRRSRIGLSICLALAAAPLILLLWIIAQQNFL